LKLTKLLFLLFLAIGSLVGVAQELPPIKNYASNEYLAENQNWNISQSEDKKIYIANGSGLLAFNGSKWQLYPSPNNSIMRSVNCVENIIYTGAYMEFGYWKENEFGKLDYVSLSSQLKEPLIEEDFWNIVHFEDWVLFQSLRRIYIYNTKDASFKIINSKTQLPKVFMVDGSIYFQKLDEGVFKIENGNAILISNDPILKQNILVNIIKINKRLLFQTQLKGFYYLNDNKLEKWDISANDIISTISVYSSLQLKDGTIVLGTISNGIYQLNTNGDLIRHVNQKKGLNNNTVLSMYEDRENNLWLGLDSGVSVVNFDSFISVYNDIDGTLGSVYNAVIFNDYLYLGTNQGLFYKKYGTENDFTFIKGTDGQVWCFKIHDNTLFCGHNKGTFVVTDGNAELISDVMGTMEIKVLNGHENLLLQGHYGGLNVLEKVNGKWKLRNNIEGFSPTPRFIEFSKNGSVLVCHEYKGVFKLELDENFTKVLNSKLLETPKKSLKSTISKYNGDVYYSSDLGIFKYNNQIEDFEIDTILSRDFLKNDTYISGKLIDEPQTNTLWGFTQKSILYFTPSKLSKELKSNKIFLSATLRRDLAGFESVLYLSDKRYLFGSSEGYLILDLNKIKEKKFTVGINSIESNTIDGQAIPVALNGNNVRFNNKQNNVSFKYNVPEFNKYKEVSFQYQLVGLYNQWSVWSTRPDVAFKNLPFGNYTFKVKARIGNEISSNVAVFSFEIEKPWYLANYMIALYSLLFVIIIVLTHFMYKINFNKQKKLLLLKKQRELAFNQLENEKLIMKLKNEKLQHEIDGKTRELANSAMSIIKKNEILNSIKDELVGVKDNASLKPVLKVINKNLANSDDWEMFQEAFNNADTDFLKKVKNVHPTLTPNDLRLCAYLRLNLASKEIAPLLNISVRSVEIKRYRLRKKMNIPHEKSLVEYILEL
jgi:DNA-binding CsgD family transcriptional regulator/ligand-binding sensor domain-containing protein